MQLAGVQYHGQAEVTQTCIDAVTRLIQAGTWITRAFVLTHENRHGMYLELSECEDVIIRPGFTSGYSGEGPAGLAIVILMLERHRVNIEEIIVSSGFLERAAESRLTRTDMERVNGARAVRPYRLSDYTWKALEGRGGEEACLRKQYPLIPPFALLDLRILDLALMLDHDADSAISKAFRLLEESVCRRCGFKDIFGRKVFERAFLTEESPLTWRGLRANEVKGRVELFTGAFSAHRNPRAHRRIEGSPAQSLREFILVNELFLLEAEAISRL